MAILISLKNRIEMEQWLDVSIEVLPTISITVVGSYIAMILRTRIRGK